MLKDVNYLIEIDDSMPTRFVAGFEEKHPSCFLSISLECQINYFSEKLEQKVYVTSCHTFFRFTLVKKIGFC